MWEIFSSNARLYITTWSRKFIVPVSIGRCPYMQFILFKNVSLNAFARRIGASEASISIATTDTLRLLMPEPRT